MAWHSFLYFDVSKVSVAATTTTAAMGTTTMESQPWPIIEAAITLQQQQHDHDFATSEHLFGVAFRVF